MACVRQRFSAGGGAQADETTSLLKTPIAASTEHERLEAFDQLRAAAAAAFESDRADHVQHLQQIWRDAFPTEPFAINSARWLDLGFQRADPRSDSQRSGLMSIKHLCKFVANLR